MCVTSPPYWGLRDYGIEPQIYDDPGSCDHDWSPALNPKGNGDGRTFRRDKKAGLLSGSLWSSYCSKCGAWKGSLGLEPTPELYIQHCVEIFREVRRVLRKDGTCWINIGDCYATGAGSARNPGGRCYGKHNPAIDLKGFPSTQPNRMRLPDLKRKDLIGIPWRLAFALRAGFSQCQDCGRELRTDLWPVWNGYRICVDCTAVKKNGIVQTEPPKTSGMSSKKGYIPSIHNRLALIKAVASGAVPDGVLDINLGALKKLANAGMLNIPGVTFTPDRQTIFR
jgi:hypothetical protein